MTSRLSIGARLLVGALVVLIPAAALLGAGGWWLMRRSLAHATDAHLLARIDGVREYLTSMERQDPPEGLEEELREYVQLSEGDVLLEVSDATGRVICGPLIPGWDARAIEGRLAAAPVGAWFADDEPVHGKRFRLAGERVVAAGREFRILAALPLAPMSDALHRFKWALAVALPLVILGAGAGAYWLGRRALAPVDRIAAGVRAITVRDLHRRLDVPRADDELRRLTVTFNEVLERLESAVADITRFTAEAAHELRTPVTLVRTTAEVALSRERDPAEYRAALTDVLANAEHMSALVGELLVLARADAGVEAGEIVDLDLRASVADAVRDVRPAMEGKGLSLVAEVPAADVPARGEPESLRRLLLIVLDNARKYTPAGGTVRVTLRTVPERAEAAVDVVDSGIGLDPRDLERVFDRFYRGARARAYDTDGSGLGLAIARTIVARHGGTIRLAPGPGGAGCAVTITIPVAATHQS